MHNTAKKQAIIYIFLSLIVLLSFQFVRRSTIQTYQILSGTSISRDGNTQDVNIQIDLTRSSGILANPDSDKIKGTVSVLTHDGSIVSTFTDFLNPSLLEETWTEDSLAMFSLTQYNSDIIGLEDAVMWANIDFSFITIWNYTTDTVFVAYSENMDSNQARSLLLTVQRRAIQISDIISNYLS